MEHRWITPVVVTASVLVGAAVYLTRPVVSHTDERKMHAPVRSQGAQDLSGSGVGQCVAAADPAVTRASLDEKYRWAHTLVEQKLYDAALPDLRYIAAKDPGYPGIHLELSDSLLQLKQPEQAQAAIDSQMAISDCVSKLASDAVDSYCSAEMPQATAEGCRSQLAYIGRATELQAALVRLEVAHQGGTDTVSKPSEVATAVQPQEAKVGSARRRVASARPAPEHRSSGDKSLMDGDGTDLSLGAYSKPQ